MPADLATSSSGSRTKPTRSSIRQSLNLSSVGKALGDIMNKESDKGVKKSKDTSARRMSAVNLMHATSSSSRASLDSKLSPVKGGGTPDSKTITSKTRRLSTVQKPISEPADEQNPSPIESVNTRHSSDATRYSLRSRNSLASSALPKYRPKSVLVDSSSKQPPSPLRAGTRRRLSHSDDEKKAKKGESKPSPRNTPRTSVEKMAKPMSPLPHRATFRVNLATVNVSPSTPPKGNSYAPLSSKVSPPRPTKAVKTSTASSAPQSAIPRPPSSASSSGSLATPRTPKASGLKSALGLGKSSREKASQHSSPLRTTIRLASESPLGRRSRNLVKNESPVKPKGLPVISMTHISEADSEDSNEADDVELLLAPIASPTAPTPAMPRMRPSRSLIQKSPQTPSRPGTLPTRADLSYRSPPADNENFPPPRSPQQSDVVRARGSILSWEQLASESSKVLGEDEIDSMLSDIPAPFNAEPVSPTPRSIPGSPCLSALHTPERFGSISQVLLPDVTPSPAIHHHSPKYHNGPSEVLAVDAAIVTLLRLQLVAAENTAKDRLQRLQILEEEVHDLKEARQRDAEGLAKQVSYMEEQLRGKMEAQEKDEEERAAYTAALEDQVRHDRAFLEQAIEAAVQEVKSGAQQLQEAALKSERRNWECARSSRDATLAWGAVRDFAENELDRVRSDMQTLSVLLAGLDQF